MRLLQLLHVERGIMIRHCKRRMVHLPLDIKRTTAAG